MDRLKPLPLHLARGPFTLEQSRRAGISRKRTRGRDLWTPSREIRVPVAAPFNLLDRCRTYTGVTPNSVVSHLTAGVIHGLYLPYRLEELRALDLARPVGDGQPRRKGVAGHILDIEPWDVDIVEGVPVTSVQRTLLDLAPLLSVDELVAIADQIVCEHHRSFGREVFPRVKLGELQAYVAAHGGARGMSKLREAMELVRVGADSRPESNLRLIVFRSPLPNFEHNVEIKDEAGDGKVGPDLACEEYKTCAEYEGGHHLTAIQQASDHDRNFVTKSLGWHQVLINKEDMKAGELVVITKIARMLVEGGWPDPQNLANRSLLGRLHTRKDFS